MNSCRCKEAHSLSNTHPDIADMYGHQLERCTCEMIYEYMDAISLCFTKIELYLYIYLCTF